MADLTGTIAGTVVDAATGQGIPRCDVSARGGITRGAETDGRGVYQIPGLPVGSYTVEAAALGYASQSTADVAVQLGRSVTCDFTLQPKP
ncbi:carboxypeptidase-like regulatory domain-containing protein [Inquilinus sp. CA228]|uniref:carboxypeptidase-like regulatory domain-containing protein n=1 Tax=Inquilinus sp. CA228 TaxID=3455609 RepID=UPI003F8D0FF4